MAAELQTFADDELPAELKCQILCAHRIEWPGGYVGENRLRDWVQRPRFHPRHFLLVERGILVSYVGVVWKLLEHGGETYKTYGLSGVYTYPAFRREGHGRRLVDAATAFIRTSDADIGLFMCKPRNVRFYAAAGWIPMPRTALFGGPRSAPYPSGEVTLTGFFSEKGKRGRVSFETGPIFFDDDLW
jgi:GNAT superfamily N-acetyltransferase